MNEKDFRDHVSRMLAWEEAHVGFEKAVDGIPETARGRRAEGVPYSAWQLLEHLRLAQHDMLDFCVNPQYKEMKWPDDYWPKDPAPPSAAAWDASVRQFLADRAALQAIATDTSRDLTAKIPHGSGQTYLRELLLVADHNAHHIGELVVVRRLLGVW